IERDAALDVRALGALRIRLREVGGARAEVIAADLASVRRIGARHVAVADDGDVISPGLERLEARRREIKRSACRSGSPEMLLRAEDRAARRTVHLLDTDQANRS